MAVLPLLFSLTLDKQTELRERKTWHEGSEPGTKHSVIKCPAHCILLAEINIRDIGKEKRDKER